MPLVEGPRVLSHEGLQLDVPAHQGGSAFPSGSVGARETEEPIRGNTLGLALQLEWLNRLHLDCRAGQTIGEGADQDFHPTCRLFESGCDVDSVPDDEVISFRGVPGHHLAGVYADAAGEPDAPALLKLVVQALERLPHAVRRSHGAMGVVLAHNR
jgi:hypothetical protein